MENLFKEANKKANKHEYNVMLDENHCDNDAYQHEWMYDYIKKRNSELSAIALCH